VEQCHACGASLTSHTEWCGQCYAPRGRASTVPTTAVLGGPTRHLPPPRPLPPQVRRTRWRKTTTTFGPVGRMLATIALVVPFLFLVVGGILTGGITIFGAGLWGFVVMPWGLRDVWRAGQLPVT
jgi:hypothetical protein